LIGSASFQTEPKGVRMSQLRPGPDNAFFRDDVRLPQGFSLTGLSIQQLLDKAQPGGTGTSIELARKNFHALFLPNEKVDFVKISREQKWLVDEEKLLRLRDKYREQWRTLVLENDEAKVKERSEKLEKDLRADLEDSVAKK